jgi:hypothetical protein
MYATDMTLKNLPTPKYKFFFATCLLDKYCDNRWEYGAGTVYVNEQQDTQRGVVKLHLYIEIYFPIK